MISKSEYKRLAAILPEFTAEVKRNTIENLTRSEKTFSMSQYVNETYLYKVNVEYFGAVCAELRASNTKLDNIHRASALLAAHILNEGEVVLKPEDSLVLDLLDALYLDDADTPK